MKLLNYLFQFLILFLMLVIVWFVSGLAVIFGIAALICYVLS